MPKTESDRRKTRKRKTSSATDILRRRYYEGKPERVASLDAERLNARIAQLVHDLRTGADLTQAQLAEQIGTTASVISRLEDSDYNGHSLSILKKIAAVFSSKLEIRFVPLTKSQKYLLKPNGEKTSIKEVVA